MISFCKVAKVLSSMSIQYVVCDVSLWLVDAAD